MSAIEPAAGQSRDSLTSVDDLRLCQLRVTAQEQLVLMQRDRERLVDAVSYTKGQAGTLVTMVHGVNERFVRLTRGAGIVGAGCLLVGQQGLCMRSGRWVGALSVVLRPEACHASDGAWAQAYTGEDLLAGTEMAVIESSLQSMVQTANKVQDVAQDAEDHHFQVRVKVGGEGGGARVKM